MSTITRRTGLRFRHGGIARAGTAFALLAAAAALGAGVLSASRAAEAQLDVERAHAISAAELAADGVARALAAGDVAATRRLVATIASTTHATGCHVELPDGTVIADLLSPRLANESLPDKWPSGDVGVSTVEVGPDRLEATVPVPIGSERQARLVLALPRVRTNALDGGLTSAMPVAAAALLLAALAVVGMRRGLQGHLAVGEAVAATRAGESDPEALLVSERFGPLADAWNHLVPRLSATCADEASSGPVREFRGALDIDLLGVAEQLWHGIVVTDSMGVIRFMNGAAALLLGVRRSDATGMRLESLVASTDFAAALSVSATGVQASRATLEVRPATAEGAPPSDSILRMSLRSLGAGNGAMVLIEDVTQQRLADRSRDAFVAQATHELRTPLTNVRLYVDELIEAGEPTAELRARCLNVISRETRRLERMVGDMLSVAEMEAGTIGLRVDDVRLEPLFEGLERDFKAYADEKKIKLEFKLPPKYPQISGDRDKIEMTIANLLGNALKYTPEGGTVTLTVRASGADVRVEVADTGIGIKDDELDLVFQSFYRSKDKRVASITGTGLGLPIARQIARLHGGDILVSSIVDRGSTFTLVLPLKSAVALAA